VDMKMLNVACGGRYHDDWINIDFHSDSSKVRQANLLEGLPFDDGLMDGVYSSHFLEHLSISDGENIVGEMYRVLKEKGVVRIVVPDLENVCREYLTVLDGIGDSDNIRKYEWITVELLDQLTRDVAGGYMQRMFDKVTNEKDMYLVDYISHRTGESLLKENTACKHKRTVTFNKVKNRILYLYLHCIQLLIPKNIRKSMIVKTNIGEKHKWMYDKYSLSKLLQEAGFNNILVKTFNTSQINSFNSFNLDCNSDGTPYKGIHSLYIEATK